MMRSSGFEETIAIISVDYSLEVVDRSVWAGADDFLVKNNNLDLSREVKILVEKRSTPIKKQTLISNLTKSAFLRCIGLTHFERTLIDKFFPNFPSQKELSYILCKSEGYIRKTFSNIYKKFNIDNGTQLARMLTLCSRFHRWDDSIT